MNKRISWLSALVAVLIALTFLSAARTDRQKAGFDWRSWLPDFIYSYFFTEELVAEREVTTAAFRAPLDPLSATLEASALTQVRNSAWPAPALDLDRELVRRREALASLVLLGDDEGRLPLSTSRPFQLVLPELGQFAAFTDFAARYAPFETRRWGTATFDALRALPKNSPVVVLIDDAFGAPLSGKSWWHPITELRDSLSLIFVHFGATATLTNVPPGIPVLQALLGDDINQEYAAQALFGAQRIEGRLSQAIGSRFPVGTGQSRPAVRLGYTAPELLGVDRRRLLAIDQTMNWARRMRAIPGGQVLVAKHGQIIYEKSFGYQTYDRSVPVRVSDLYDLASVTKSAATALSIMKLVDAGELSLEDRLGEIVPAFARTPSRNLRIDQLLAHHTGLQPNIPANEYLGRYRELFAREHTDSFPFPMGPNRFVAKEVVLGIQENLTQLYPARRPFYQYSDANYALLREAVEAVSERGLDDFLRVQFSEPLGLRRLVFNPAYLYPADHLVPAGIDNWMRGGELRGFVHDESAALLGGVSGHAGLFANAHDLAALFQLLLNEGSYAGQQFLSPATVEQFTRRSTYNHRALGFERLEAAYSSVIRAGASPLTFGHTGFVGTCAWADPENELVYIFLSNRTYPDSKNDKLIKFGIRERIHRLIYQSLGSYRSEAA